MQSFFSNKKLIVLLVGIIILVALIGFSVRSERSLSAPEKAIRDVIGWGQNVVARPTHFVGGIVNNIQEMFDVYEENQLLKARLDEYTKVSVERDSLIEKNARLREALELKDKLDDDYTSIAAVVIHRAPDAWEQYIGLNRGEQDGAAKNMAVIDSKGGLVGKVKKTSKFTSYVQLLSDNDPTNRVSAKVMIKGKVVGFVEGYDVKESLLIMRKVDMDKEIPEDTKVITSGLGGIYPPDLLIGEVERTEVDEYGLTQNVYIRPQADFSRLDYVFIAEQNGRSFDQSLLEEGEDE